MLIQHQGGEPEAARRLDERIKASDPVLARLNDLRLQFPVCQAAPFGALSAGFDPGRFVDPDDHGRPGWDVSILGRV